MAVGSDFICSKVHAIFDLVEPCLECRRQIYWSWNQSSLIGRANLFLEKHVCDARGYFTDGMEFQMKKQKEIEIHFHNFIQNP